MENKYIIICRYECWTRTGKEFTDWFAYKRDPMSKSEAEESLKECKKNCSDIDKRTKLKHEFDLKLYDEYVKEQNEIMENVKKISKEQEEYYKSDAYKELQKKKRQANKELKERQRIYNETHKKEEADF